ncbi:dienelactone hydrolase family protein [Allopontixanthobacter sediminis]|uniref:Dienelactone hydrolase family protein n=1 Tax=Allopontixanthobacter sediminis TaxID=1689985 RepID=A0A845AZK3_9SPHN|nr:dienelactone hydrolase family protein [Allopontixanthobacter sediminis]MXP44461.1 dienelactone hydrolase family protein [Allopontixanthobacter sediminis]
MNDTATIQTLSGEGSFEAYVAKPAGNAKAAILVIQEIFGVNQGIREKCDKWAEAGYLAVAPDLFWRLEPGIQLDPDVEDQFNRALELFGKYDADEGVKDIEATIHWIRREAAVSKVGCVGYCLGGKLAYMTATRTDIDASVGYYGVMIDQMLREAKAIAHPLMLHIPTADHFVSAEAQKAMHEGLDDHPKVTLHDYEGLDHGFATESGKRRNEEGARLADSRTAEFFAKHLL